MPRDESFQLSITIYSLGYFLLCWPPFSGIHSASSCGVFEPISTCLGLPGPFWSSHVGSSPGLFQDTRIGNSSIIMYARSSRMRAKGLKCEPRWGSTTEGWKLFVENSSRGKVEKRTVPYMLGIGVAACVPRSKKKTSANDDLANTTNKNKTKTNIWNKIEQWKEKIGTM